MQITVGIGPDAPIIHNVTRLDISEQSTWLFFEDPLMPYSSRALLSFKSTQTLSIEVKPEHIR